MDGSEPPAATGGVNCIPGMSKVGIDDGLNFAVAGEIRTGIKNQGIIKYMRDIQSVQHLLGRERQ